MMPLGLGPTGGVTVRTIVEWTARRGIVSALAGKGWDMGVSVSERGGVGIPQRRRNAIGRRGLPVAALVVALGSLLACQAEVVEKRRVVTKDEPVAGTGYVEKPRCKLPELKEAAKFVTEAWAVPDNKFNIGEPLKLQMRVGSPTYINVFHVSTSCKVTRLVQDRVMVAGEIVDFPAQDMHVVVKPPAGEEAFYFVATRAKLKVFAKADILRGDEIASLDLTPEQFFVRLDQASGRINPDDLSITTLRTTVVRH